MATWTRQAAIVVSGAVLGVALDRLTKGVAGISGLSLAVVAIAGIAMFFSFEDNSRSLADFRGLTVRQTAGLQAELLDLKRRLALNVSFQGVKALNSLPDISGDKIAQAMLSAKRELLIVDLIPASGARPDASMRSDLLAEQWEAMLRLPLENSSLTYRRMCQVPSLDGKLLIPALEADFVDHCDGMLKLKRDHGARVSLRFAPTKYPYKFMIVDGTILILELHRFRSDGTDPVVDQELVIHDPDGSITDSFRAMWDDLADQPETRAAVPTDLRPHSP
ncbi:hypothetical protein [Actinoplanes sp. NPDC049802]|uniref:hypothetical protein n=1 Tax=Actinoplanes sp. NPDC049802 TaxID=3154742 RepID=UPI0033E91FA4